MKSPPKIKPQNKQVLFQSKEVRRLWHKKEWYYSVVDIIAALTDSPTPRQYWGKVKQREFTSLELSPIWVQLLGRSISTTKNFLDHKPLKKIGHSK